MPENRVCKYTGEGCVEDKCGEGCKLYEYRHSELSDREKCLKWICEEDAAICNHPFVYPCTWCSAITGIPVRKVRKIMKQLEAEGYVKKDSEGGYNDWADRIECIHGYSVTEKGRNTDYWKEQDRKEREWIENSLKEGAENDT